MANLPSALSFIDTETTGLNPKRHRIVEIGVIRVENGEVVDSLDSLVQPHTHLPPEITMLTGITAQELARAPDFDELKHQVGSILSESVFVAHNARFDYAFIKHEFARHGSEFRAKVLCTVRLARKLFPKVDSFTLESLINYFGLKPTSRHRAYADAEVLWQLYRISLENHGTEKVSETINSLLKSPSLPAYLAEEVVEKLPELPGIYMFYGEDSKLPLYVGKSINIKDRVKSHFSSDYQNTTDLAMTSQIKKVDTLITAGELGALIREADSVKALMPVYNRKLRRRRDLLVALAGETNGYSSAELKTLHKKAPEVANILAVYKSKKSAKIALHSLARLFHLCPKLLGLEKGSGPCFASQINICHGACAGKESAEAYNKRFKLAFEETRVLSWPYTKPIVIKEENLAGVVELHLVDQWTYLGSVSYNATSEDAPKIEKYSPRFDWDIYKILQKAVLGKKAILPLTQEIEALFS